MRRLNRPLLKNWSLTCWGSERTFWPSHAAWFRDPRFNQLWVGESPKRPNKSVKADYRGVPRDDPKLRCGSRLPLALCAQMTSSGAYRQTDRGLLASFIEYAADGKVTRLEWERFIVEHYVGASLERARAECVRLLLGYGETPPESQVTRSRLYAMAKKLREST